MAGDRSIIQRIDESGVPLLLARLLIGGFFVYTGIQKVSDPLDFLKQIRVYGLLPESPAVFLNSTAIVLPWLEIICGVALILGVWVRGASVQIALMLAAFTPAILVRAMAVRAEEGTPFLQIAFDCGCGTGMVIIWEKLLANTGLFLVVLVALLSRSRRFCIARWYDRRRSRAAYCRRCGYAVRPAGTDLCERCANLAAFPVGAANPAG